MMGLVGCSTTLHNIVTLTLGHESALIDCDGATICDQLGSSSFTDILISQTGALVGDHPRVSCLLLFCDCTFTDGRTPTIPSFPASPRSPATHLLSEETSIDDGAAAAALDEDGEGFLTCTVTVRNEEFTN